MLWMLSMVVPMRLNSVVIVCMLFHWCDGLSDVPTIVLAICPHGIGIMPVQGREAIRTNHPRHALNLLPRCSKPATVTPRVYTHWAKHTEGQLRTQGQLRTHPQSVPSFPLPHKHLA